MGAVLSLQGDRKVVIYSDSNLEPNTAFGNDRSYYNQFQVHGNGHQSNRSFFGHSSNSKNFKLANALFGGTHHHNHQQQNQNQSKSNRTAKEVTKVTPHHTYHNHHGLKSFINALHLGKHFGFGKEKKTKHKHDLTWHQPLNNINNGLNGKLYNNKENKENSCVIRNGIQKSLSCYNLKSGTTTSNIEIVKNINKNVVYQEENNNNNVTKYNNDNSKILSKRDQLGEFGRIFRKNELIVPENSGQFLCSGRKPIRLTAEQFSSGRGSDMNKSPPSKPSTIYLSNCSQSRPNVYIQQTQIGGVNSTQIVAPNSSINGTQPHGNHRKSSISNVSLSSVGSCATNSDTPKSVVAGQKRTVIQVGVICIT